MLAAINLMNFLNSGTDNRIKHTVFGQQEFLFGDGGEGQCASN